MAKYSRPTNAKARFIFNATKTVILNIGYTGRAYTYERIQYKSSKILQLTKELAEFGAHLKSFTELQLPKNIKAYITGVVLEGDWMKIEFLPTTPLKVKQVVRNELMKTDFATFVNKPYAWSTATNSRDYLAIGPRSKKVGKMWTLSGNQYHRFIIR